MNVGNGGSFFVFKKLGFGGVRCSESKEVYTGKCNESKQRGRMFELTQKLQEYEVCPKILMQWRQDLVT